MRNIYYVILLITVLLVFTVAGPILAVQANGSWEIPPENGITLQQVDFTFPSYEVENSDWGRVEVDPEVMSEYTGETKGYLNIWSGIGWAVSNLLVDTDSGIISTYFTLYNYSGTYTDVTTLEVVVIFSLSPVSGLPSSYGSFDYDIGNWEWNAQGAGDENVTALGPPPPLITTAPGSPPDEAHILPNPPNVDAAKNQCFPMSIANSLQYMEEAFGLDVPNDHEEGQDGDQSLVGQLDELANRSVTDRWNGSGVWFVPMLEGKFDYLADNNLQDQLVHKHQGHGYGDPANDEALPDGDFEHNGSISREEGNLVTWEWICNEIKKGEDVELVFEYDGGGGHAVRVVGCGITDGKKWIRYAHDAVQAYKVNSTEMGDNGVGLEIVEQKVSDLDGDGTLNLGSEGREIRFVMSESVKHCTDEPYYEQEKIAQAPIPWQFWQFEAIPETLDGYNLIDLIRLSPTWLEPPSGLPAGEGSVFVNRQYAKTIDNEPIMERIPLSELVWNDDYTTPVPSRVLDWTPVGGDPVEVVAGTDVELTFPEIGEGVYLVAYEVLNQDYEVVGHFINEAIIEDMANGTGPFSPVISEVLVNFDVHNDTGCKVTNFELDFEGIDFVCCDVEESLGMVVGTGETWGANPDYPLVVSPIEGGTEVKWIQDDRPLQPCEWLHCGLVFRIPDFTKFLDGKAVQGYWTVPPPPPPTPEDGEGEDGEEVGITVMPVNKAGLVMPWAITILAIILVIGMVVRVKYHR